jgi:serine/threonine-protein kinase
VYTEQTVAAPSEIDFSLAPGELVAGRYLVTRVLGRGGMGEVYEAADQLLGEPIALKTLRRDLARA